MIECTFSFAQSIAQFDRFSEPFCKRRGVSRVTSSSCGQIAVYRQLLFFYRFNNLYGWQKKNRERERKKYMKRRRNGRGRKRTQLLAFDDLLLLRQDQGYRAGSAHARCGVHVSGLYLGTRTHTHTQWASGTGAITTTVFLTDLDDVGSIYRMTVSIFVPAGFCTEKREKGERDGESRKSPAISDKDENNEKEKRRKKEEGGKRDVRLSLRWSEKSPARLINGGSLRSS